MDRQTPTAITNETYERYEEAIGEWGEDTEGELHCPDDVARTWMQIRPAVEAAMLDNEKGAKKSLSEGDRVFALCVEAIVMSAVEDDGYGEFPWEALRRGMDEQGVGQC